MALYDFVLAPFVDFGFMRRALLGACLLTLAASPLGVFLMLRRMSLTGDAMAHAILPGAALGFMFFGLNLLPMTIGGLVAGLLVAFGAGAVARLTVQREDASLAAFYLISLAFGVVLISVRGSSVDLMHVLFGSVLALDSGAMGLIGGVSLVTVVAMALLWRALVAECMDPLFFRTVSRLGGFVHFAFLGLVVLNLVAGFQALGSLMVVGLMMLPAAAARFWSARVGVITLLALGFGLLSSALGLLASYHWALPAGPSIILAAGVIYLVSMVAGRRGLLSTRPQARHRTA
ncbi:metal ABC transporter permease [Ketogulonicigenium robustum]